MILRNMRKVNSGLRKMSKKATDVIDRLLQVFECKNDSELCILLNVKSQSTLSSWRSRDSVPYALCVDVSEQKKISLDWLLTGKGDMCLKTGLDDLHATKIVQMYEALNDVQQREILSALEEKKQLNNLMEAVHQLQLKVG